MTGRFNGRQYNIIIYIMLYCLLAQLKQVALYFHCKSLEIPGWGLGAPSVELGHEQSQRQVEFGPDTLVAKAGRIPSSWELQWNPTQ